jgi:hypothetical protein
VAWSWKVENWDENGRGDDRFPGRGELDFTRFLLHILRLHGSSVKLCSDGKHQELFVHNLCLKGFLLKTSTSSFNGREMLDNYTEGDAALD